MAAVVEHDNGGLLFFNQLWGRLNIDLSEPAQPISERLINRGAARSARLERVSLVMQVVVNMEDNHYRELDDEEWSRVVLRAPRVRLRGMSGRIVEHRAPDGVTFTVRDLVMAIAETERQTRGETNWFGGIDVHHVYFGGIMLEDDGAWSVGWGS